MQKSARIGLISERDSYPAVYRCNGFELEDVITEVDDVDIVRVRYPAGGSGSLVNRALRRVGRLAGLEVGRHVRIERPKLEHEYDMIFIGLTGCMHLTKYEPFIREWKDKARLVVCYIEELWKGWLGHDELIAPLASFDHVLLGCSGTVSALADAIGRPVTYFSPAIDMDRFCPYPNAPRRTIDVRSMGRRSARTHVALREWAEETGATYLYDANTVEVPVLRDPAAYRVHTAEVLKRSRYFLVNPAKIDRPEDTGGQQEIGLRFYEGAGAGCVLVGQSPRCEAFERNFDWKDAIIEVPYDSSDVAEVLRALDSDPERVARIRVENVAQCLERHDWVHRWFHSLGQLGMLPREAALGRRRRLAERAAQIRSEDLESGMRLRVVS